MLNENIRTLRKSRGLSQEELALRLNVVRQTVSKWEQGLSVPDADMLISISEVFETPVSTLLGETLAETKPDEIKALSDKLEAINRQLASRKTARRRALHWFFIALCVLISAGFALLVYLNSPYLAWDYTEAETAVFGTVFHAAEWLYIRAAPLALLAAIAGICLTRRRG